MKKKRDAADEYLKMYDCLSKSSNYIFTFMGLAMATSSLVILGVALYQLILCLLSTCDFLDSMINFVGYLIISVAIFDVGRYLLEEEVFRDRELRSPQEARKSLTKFMVIIVIALTLEALLSLIKATSHNLELIFYPASLFFVATFLLVGLGLYQKMSVQAEAEVSREDL